MPLYEYQCIPNHHTFEIRQPITADPVKECPECGGEVRRVIHPVGIVFKGSGFYATDSRGKGVSSSTRPAGEATETKAESKPAAESSGSKSDTGGSASTTTASTESKPAANK